MCFIYNMATLLCEFFIFIKYFIYKKKIFFKFVNSKWFCFYQIPQFNFK